MLTKEEAMVRLEIRLRVDRQGWVWRAMILHDLRWMRRRVEMD